MNYTNLAHLIRRRSEGMLTSRLMPEQSITDQRDNAELLNCLARMLEGKPIHKAFGAPGDWGYGTPIGDALIAAYQAPSPEAPKPLMCRLAELVEEFSVEEKRFHDLRNDEAETTIFAARERLKEVVAEFIADMRSASEK
ncbi:MAG: hypothetical protein Q8Q59_08345 [Luteolibacter sp.]|nr:hypothetical protein [Luteolibacter sp.]